MYLGVWWWTAQQQVRQLAEDAFKRVNDAWEEVNRHRRVRLPPAVRLPRSSGGGGGFGSGRSSGGFGGGGGFRTGGGFRGGGGFKTGGGF